MTCTHCCDANKFFDIKNAEKELKKYQKKGASGTTKRLIQAFESISIKDKSLLDIGGGIGMLQWHFLRNGASDTTDIDASLGYLDVAKQFAIDNNWEGKTTFKHGDFNDFSNELNVFDVVTLDRVVCCYPDFHTILKNAAAKSSEYLALSYPMSNWISRMINKIGRIYFLFKKSEFKTYVHPSKEIELHILDQGFEKKHNSIKFPWYIQVYRRNKDE